jgi:hypothetical protein
MGREVRRVRGDWRHPRDERGRHVPLFGRSYRAEREEYDEEAARWAAGFIRGYPRLGERDWEPRAGRQLAMTFEEWHGEPPRPEEHMPDWPEEERTHFQMYETTTEGTPISPVMATPELLARWLADHHASASGSQPATYEQWLRVCRGGFAPSAVAVVRAGVVERIESGVAGLGEQGGPRP